MKMFELARYNSMYGWGLREGFAYGLLIGTLIGIALSCVAVYIARLA